MTFSFHFFFHSLLPQLSHQSTVPASTQDAARFLGSHNPAQVKRNVLASFTDVLLLPVTIVPRTTVAMGKAFGAALTQGGNAAVQGIAMLNPQRWGASVHTGAQKDGYGQFGNEGGAMVFDIGMDEEDDEDEKRQEKATSRRSDRKDMRCRFTCSLLRGIKKL